MKKKVLLRVVIFSVLIIVFSGFGVCLVLVAMVVIRGDGNSNSRELFYDYQYKIIDRNLNEITSGTMTTRQKNLESFFYNTPTEERSGLTLQRNSQYLLIPNFGDVEYVCYGTCHCESDPRRSSSSTFVFKGLQYFVAASSSLLAIQIAGKYFREECAFKTAEGEGGSECSEIRSEVEMCSHDILLSEQYSDELDFEEDDLFQMVRKRQQLERGSGAYGMKEYYCRGTCHPKTFVNEERNEIAKQFGCERLKIDRVISVEIVGKKTAIFNSLAITQFRKEYLKPFCKECSKWMYYADVRDPKTKELLSVSKKWINLCSAAKMMKYPHNSNIKCKLTKYIEM